MSLFGILLLVAAWLGLTFQIYDLGKVTGINWMTAEPPEEV